MISRIVEISSPAYVHVRQGQLLVERENEEPVQVPLEDLGVLILDNPAIRLTQATLSACGANSVVVIAADSKHLPTSLTLPSDANSLHGKYVAMQAAMTQPTRKRLWQLIVRGKIQAQARCLARWGREHEALDRLACRVRSGDPTNVEAQAARIYWPTFFGPAFRRSDRDNVLNGLLNYGYAVVRAGVARAICAAGLHPGLGLHHHNQYDAFCLADDLVEPLRPAVDSLVMAIRTGTDGDPRVDRSTKQQLLGILTTPVEVGAERLPLLSALHVYAASARQEMCGERGALAMPTV